MPPWTWFIEREAPVLIREIPALGREATVLFKEAGEPLVKEIPVIVRGSGKSIAEAGGGFWKKITLGIGSGLGAGRLLRVGKLAVPAMVGAGVGYSIGRTGTLPFLPKLPHLPIPGFGSDHDSGKGGQLGSGILTYGLLFLAIILSLLLLRKKK